MTSACAAVRLIAAGTATWLVGCGSQAPPPQYINSDVHALGCAGDRVVGDRFTVDIDIRNRDAKAWPRTFVLVAGSTRMIPVGVSAPGSKAARERGAAPNLYRLDRLGPQATRRVRITYIASQPGHDSVGLTAWGASAPDPPLGASDVKCPVLVRSNRSAARPAQRRGAVFVFTGAADRPPGGRALGTLVVPHDSTLRLTADGYPAEVRMGATIQVEFTGDELSTRAQAGPRSTHAERSRYLAAGTYHNVRIKAVGRWAATITPR